MTTQTGTDANSPGTNRIESSMCEHDKTLSRPNGATDRPATREERRRLLEDFARQARYVDTSSVLPNVILRAIESANELKQDC